MESLSVITIMIILVVLNVVALLHWFFSDSGLIIAFKTYLKFLVVINLVLIVVFIVAAQNGVFIEA